MSFPIKSWAEDDRPREKMLHQGRSALSDAELIAIVLGTGTKDQTALDLARQLLSNSQNDLSKLARCSLAELQKCKGIGPAKAITLSAALEMGNRKKSAEFKPVQISSSLDAFQHLGPRLEDHVYEEFHVLLLSRSNRVISVSRVSQGGVSGTVVDPKRIFKLALEAGASCLILCHNHPSGNLTPSPQDIQITKNLHAAGKLLEIQVIDHLIICGQQYYSFADEGQMP